MTIKEALQSKLKGVSIVDAEIILAHIIKKTREFVFAHPEYTISPKQRETFLQAIAMRSKHKPVAQITGIKEFYGLDFIVNKYTLIPRPETELIVDAALQEIRTNPSKKTVVADIGTGSGNIIISIANVTKNLPMQFFGIDISPDALLIAKKNARRHKLKNHIRFLHGSLLAPLIENLKLKLENSKVIITANLPYLSKYIYKSTPEDVKKYEPKTALYSPEEGLQHYRKLLEQVKKLMKNEKTSVILFFEISPEQKKLLPALIKSILPTANIEFQKDLAGKWRICKISY